MKCLVHVQTIPSNFDYQIYTSCEENQTLAHFFTSFQILKLSEKQYIPPIY